MDEQDSTTQNTNSTETNVSPLSNVTLPVMAPLSNSTLPTIAPLSNSTLLTTATSSNAILSNITEEERMSYLEHLENEKWPYIYPAIIYYLILMTLGIIGNSIVIAVYIKKFKPSMPRFFILTLAIFDLLTCSLSIPGVIVELRYHYTMFFPVLCKIIKSSRTYFGLVSMFTLFIVAVDRFRKVCRTLKPQYTMKSARWSVFATNIVALCYTLIGPVIAGARTVTTEREDIFGSNCSYEDDFVGRPIVKIYSALLFLTSIACVILLVVLYSLIGRQVWKHRQFMFTKGKASKNATASSQMDSQSTVLSKYNVTESEVSPGHPNGTEMESVISTSFAENTTYRLTSSQEKPLGSREKTSKEPADQNEQSSVSKESINPTQGRTFGGQKRSTGKTTFTLFIITVFFIGSFLPFLIIQAAWGYDWRFVNGLQGYTLTVFMIIYHSYHVNSVVNCFIYGFFNPKFRHECKQLLCHKCSK